MSDKGAKSCFRFQLSVIQSSIDNSTDCIQIVTLYTDCTCTDCNNLCTISIVQICIQSVYIQSTLQIV